MSEQSRMQTLSIAGLVTLSIVTFGCTQRGNDAAGAARMIGGFTDRMCGCKDKDCATKVNDDLTRWMQDMSTTADRITKPSEADQKKMEESAMRFGECHAKLLARVADDSTRAESARDTMGGAEERPGTVAGAEVGAGASPDSVTAGAGMARPGATRQATGATLEAAEAVPAECAQYKAAMARYMACDGIPQSVKDAMKLAFEAMSASWANMAAMPSARAKAAILDGCTKSADLIRRAAAEANCPR